MSRIPPRIEQKRQPPGGISSGRLASWEIVPIVEDGITYSIIRKRIEDAQGNYTAQEMFLKATDSTGKVLWQTRFFHEDFDQNLEIDVQEVFPVDLAFAGPWVEVKLEHYTRNDRVFRMAKISGDLAPKSSA